MKRLLPERLRLYLRRFGRLRWITKARKLRAEGGDQWSWLRRTRYVLADPEVDTYTYEVANQDELAEVLGRVVDRSAGDVSRLMGQAQADHALGRGLARQIGWRALYMKPRPSLPAHHLAAWVLIRTQRPEVAVEAGVLEGLGSRVMLRALELNARDGSDGVLVSLDTLPNAGHALVGAQLAARWEPVCAPAPDGLEAAIRGRRVTFFLSDSLPDRAHILSELEALRPLLSPGAVLMTVHGWTGALEEFASMHGGTVERFKEQPRDHFYDGRDLGWLRMPG